MQIIDYVEKTELQNKPEKEKALLLCFYRIKEYREDNIFDMPIILDLFSSCGYSMPNSSRLKNNLTSGSNKTFRSIKSTQKLEIIPLVLQNLERDLGKLWEDDITIDSNSELLDEQKFCGKRGFLDKLIHQINHCYSNNCYDGSAVLMRRLLEVLLILSYQKIGIDDCIKAKDENGYIMLDGIVKDAMSNTQLNLSRIKSELDKIRKVGNFSAHGLTYSASKKDIDDIKLGYRVLVEELYSKSGLMK